MKNIDYVKEAESHSVEASDIQLVGMKLGDEEYAIDVLKIQEIIRTVEITIVPRSDPFVLGVMNLRGKVIPVIDLRVRFNLEKTDFDKATRVIVVRFEKEQIGFVVDEVTQVIRIAKSMVEPTPPLVGAIGQEYILGICKFNERLIILLDIDRVVGEGDSDSALRQRILEKKELKAVPKQKAAASPEPIKPASAETVKPVESPKKYSMADEVGKPVITSVNTAESDVLNDVVAQSAPRTKDGALINQNELDGLLAGAGISEEKQKQDEAAENALNIEDLIALELSKREAETEELNKRKREKEKDQEKKK